MERTERCRRSLIIGTIVVTLMNACLPNTTGGSTSTHEHLVPRWTRPLHPPFKERRGIEGCGLITFVDHRIGHPTRLVTLDPTSGTIRTLLRLRSEHSWSDALWSPTAHLIALTQEGTGSQPHWQDLYVIRADGSGIRQLTFDRNIGSITWSPDGRSIAVEDLRGPKGEVRIVDLRGRQKYLIDGHDHWFSRPDDAVWSPDGRHVAFSVKGDEYGNISLVNADGRRPRQLFGCCAESPDWDPKGERLVFVSGRGIRSLAIDRPRVSEVIYPHASFASRPDWAPC